MSLKSALAAFIGIFSPVEKLVHELFPAIGDDLKAMSDTLTDPTMPGMTKLETLAEHAVKLVADVKGVTISKSIGIALAQKAFTDHNAAVVSEAEALLAKL